MDESSLPRLLAKCGLDLAADHEQVANDDQGKPMRGFVGEFADHVPQEHVHKVMDYFTDCPKRGSACASPPS